MALFRDGVAGSDIILTIVRNNVMISSILQSIIIVGILFCIFTIRKIQTSTSAPPILFPMLGRMLNFRFMYYYLFFS